VVISSNRVRNFGGNEVILMFSVNYLAIIASAVAMMVLGFLWYGPVFGKMWMKQMGLTKTDMDAAKKKGMTKQYALMTASALVMSYVFANVLMAFDVYSVGMALQAAFWTWIGFIATVLLGKVLWENKSWELYCLDASYYLVGLGIVGVILTVWK
jgi:hypothetical protein